MRLHSRESVAQHALHRRDLGPPGTVWQHREGLVQGFTQRYGIKRLVWFELHDTMEGAILREKRIKRWPRAWKFDLIHERNRTWSDLAEEFGFPPLPLK